MTTRPCGDGVAHLLRAHGVDTVFGMPGAHTLALYRALGAAGIKHVGVRHEGGAGFMADGYARAARRPGVALLISGPGVTNAATPLGQAYSDSVPVLALTAAVARADLGMGLGALHEIADQQAVTAPLTGASALALTPEQVPAHLAAAFARFAAARPRPVHLSIPLDVLEAALSCPDEVPPVPSPPGPDPAAIGRLARLLAEAETPVILAGGGAVGAAAPLRAVVEATGALFVTTIAGKGILQTTIRSPPARPCSARRRAALLPRPISSSPSAPRSPSPTSMSAPISRRRAASIPRSSSPISRSPAASLAST